MEALLDCFWVTKIITQMDHASKSGDFVWQISLRPKQREFSIVNLLVRIDLTS